MRRIAAALFLLLPFSLAAQERDQPGQGYPKFDQKKADEYFRKVNDKVFALIRDTIAKWDEAGV
jgi:hypothetical protein